MQNPSLQTALRLGRAIDLFIAAMAVEKRTPRSRRTYERQLLLFARAVDPLNERTVETIRTVEIEHFLGRWRDRSASTLATNTSIQRSFWAYLAEHGYVEASPAAKVKRPRKLKPEDVRPLGPPVKAEDVERIMFGCESFQELLCVGAAAYLGRRRAALARARRQDADLERGLISFTEKGGKLIDVPVPNEFLEILREADAQGVWASPQDYLIPNRRRSTTNQRERSDKVIYETVLKVAARVGVRCSVHSLRAAFAVNFLTAKPDRIKALKELMGHDRIETTMVYLRRMDRAKEMDDVRDLSWSGLNRKPERRIRDSNPCLREGEEESPDGAILSPLAAKLLELRVSERAE